MKLRALLTGVAAMAVSLLVGASAAYADSADGASSNFPEFSPALVTNTCPDTTISTTLTGNVEDLIEPVVAPSSEIQRPGQIAASASSITDLSGYKVSLAIYARGNPQVIESGVVAADSEGLFSYTVHGEYASGSYYASIVPYGPDGKVAGTSQAIPFEVDNRDCGTLADLSVVPNLAQNVCPATTADTTFSGAIENFNAEDDYVINAAIYTADGVLVEYDPALAFDDEGNFSYDVSDLEAGEYYVSVNLNTNGVDGESEAVPFEVEISECATLVDMAFEPNPVQNVCPATTGDTTLTGVIENFNEDDDYTVGVGIYAVGNDDVISELSDSDIEINDDGTFSFDVNGVDAGEYYASVSLTVNGEWVNTWAVDFEVDISECAIDDGDDNGEEGEDEGDDKGDDSDKGEDETTDPIETLPEDEDDVLSETGVSPALLITMALGLGGSGFLIRRFAL